MKNVCIIIFLLVTYSSFSQTQIIDSFPRDGFLFDNGWKFQRGDNIDYANPGYEDKNWQTINPTLDIQELPQVTQGIVWLRLHFVLDTNLLKDQLVLVINQSGASQIYLNGSLIYTAGAFDTNLSKLKAYDPAGRFISLPVKKAGEQILSVRYALQPGVRYTAIFEWPNYVFKSSLNTLDMATHNTWQYMFFVRGTSFFTNGIFFIFGVLHFCFFLFYRSQKANLYFSLFAFLNMAGLFIFFSFEYLPWVQHKFYVFNLAAALISIGGIFMFTALYHLLEQKRNLWYFVLVSLSVIGIVIYALPGYWGWSIGGGLISVLINLEIARISFKAVKKKKRGAWIVAAGCICYFLCWTAFLILRNLRQPGSLDILIGIIFTTSLISIPLSISIYLGFDFAFTNRLLQKKFVEVNELSQKTIVQEKEKQQLLASQNETLEKQVGERTAALSESLAELKSTQAQLIQSEKMASLGELTAGIAHEIQNPLNFVNNFSEVNNELIEELKSQKSKLKSEEQDELLNDIFENNEKINHHGKRADAIVKGMLQHSRQTSGTKEPTDINALCDEYLRLSYHGLRAKDKEFNADFKTDFDESIGKINIVPQDISIVLLNLYNNAFYAVNEKAKQQLNGYEPTISVSTKLSVPSPLERGWGEAIILTVMDNGNGIPQNIVDKIFQPFFTTKPTGQGTGLGLSLSYDIITKEHNGSIKVESKEGEGTSFIIQLIIT